jgi:hypothetical protein
MSNPLFISESDSEDFPALLTEEKLLYLSFCYFESDVNYIAQKQGRDRVKTSVRAKKLSPLYHKEIHIEINKDISHLLMFLKSIFPELSSIDENTKVEDLKRFKESCINKDLTTALRSLIRLKEDLGKVELANKDCLDMIKNQTNT